MEQDERDDLARQLFAIVTGMLEDAASLAVQGQDKGGIIPAPVRAALLERIALQAIRIVGAIQALPYD